MKKIPGILEALNIERVRTAAWMFEEGNFFPECSACGQQFYSKPSRFCPNCGGYIVNYEPAVELYERTYEEYKRGSENG